MNSVLATHPNFYFPFIISGIQSHVKGLHGVLMEFISHVAHGQK